MKREILEKSHELTIYELMVSDLIYAKEADIIRKKLEEAIDAYEASNKMPNSSAVISSSVFKEAIKTIKENECKIVPVTNVSSSVTYSIEVKMYYTEFGNNTYYSVIANFYKYEEV